MGDLEPMLREYGRVAEAQAPAMSLPDFERTLTTRGERVEQTNGTRADAEESDAPRRTLWRGLAAVATVAVLVLAVGVVMNRPNGDTLTATGDQPADAAGAVETEPVPPPVTSLDRDDLLTSSPSEATGGTPLPELTKAVLADDGSPPLPLGTITELPQNHRLDFLFEFCWETCFRDAHFMDPTNPLLGSGPWPAGKQFHIRHGFVNEGEEPLGAGYDVVIYATRLDEPGEFGGSTTGKTLRYSSDFVIRGDTSTCGPAYKQQAGPVTCEWFVHDFPDGLAEGRWAIWAVWEAPCAAWVDFGLTEGCSDAGEVLSYFSSGVDSPFDPLYTPTFTERNMVRMTAAEIEESLRP